MGRYLPVIKTAECGSLTRAAHALGYTQPSLGYIINNIEDELGVKLFYRDQRGVTLTETGADLLEIMRQIESMEERLKETARLSQGGLLRVAIFPSVAAQWLPAILQTFYEKHPGVSVKLEHQVYYLNGELGVQGHTLDCAFFTGKCPSGLESIPLYEDPYYLVVSTASPLAQLEEAVPEEVRGKYRFIPTHESFDSESAIWDLYKTVAETNLVDFEPQENRMAVAMVDMDLGVTILPGLDLEDIPASRQVKCIPLKGRPTRTISLLCPREAERSPLTASFLQITCAKVEEWKGRSHFTGTLASPKPGP